MRRFVDGLTLIEVVLVVLTAALCLPVAVVLLQFGVGAVLSAGPVIVVVLALVSIPMIVVSWCVVAAQQSVVSATADDFASPRTIATVATDFEAALIVDELSRNGIRARAMGDYTFGFNHVHVVVTREDFERAEAIL